MRFCKKTSQLIFVGFIILVVAGNAAFAQDLHFVGREPERWEPCTPEDLIKRIDQAAAQYKAYAPIPRAGFIDIAYPCNEEEAKALAGYSVVLIVSISQDKAELPLSRVYVVVDGKPMDLELLVSVESTIPKKKRLIVTTFGANRSDALYLMPINAAMKKGTILVDFAKNRYGFKLYELQEPDPSSVGRWDEWPTRESRPLTQVLEDFICREFPCFIAK